MYDIHINIIYVYIHTHLISPILGGTLIDANLGHSNVSLSRANKCSV